MFFCSAKSLNFKPVAVCLNQWWATFIPSQAKNDIVIFSRAAPTSRPIGKQLKIIFKLRPALLLRIVTFIEIWTKTTSKQDFG